MNPMQIHNTALQQDKMTSKKSASLITVLCSLYVPNNGHKKQTREYWMILEDLAFSYDWLLPYTVLP